MYTSNEQGIRERFPERWSSCASSVIESIPFYHVDPGSRCLAIGTTGCNFRCRYCSNAYFAKEDPEAQQDRLYSLAPGKLVATAKKLNCRSLVFSINEPTVSIPSLLDVAREAKAAGLPLGCLTNAYTTEEGTEILAAIFSFFNIIEIAHIVCDNFDIRILLFSSFYIADGIIINIHIISPADKTDYSCF